MNILHTSDWHFGKTLEGRGREAEHKLFADELCKICDDKNIDLVIVAGDIFDNANPNASSERLFYKTVSRLTDNGKRLVVVISGNHDNAARLSAADTLAYARGVIIIGLPLTTIPTGEYDGYCVSASGAGWFEIKLNGETAVILAMPYPSEKRLSEGLAENAMFDSFNSDEESQKSYSEKIGDIFAKLSEHFSSDKINIAVGHFYTSGAIESDSERPIQLGGVYSVDKEALPKSAHYIAMGHLHKAQKVADNCYYSGSPLQFDKSESVKKYVFVAKLEPNKTPEIEKIPLSPRKPIITINAENVTDAIKKCSEAGDAWIYLNVLTETALSQSEIKEIKSSGEGILKIIPVLKNDFNFENEIKSPTLSPLEQFAQFYELIRETPPSEELVNLFIETTAEEEYE